ncbi:AfsR/SARP family transcriptional regulator [Mycobacterium sp. MMS18-G62]
MASADTEDSSDQSGGAEMTTACCGTDDFTHTGTHLSLMGGFALRVTGKHLSLPLHARRVLAYLSLDKMVAPDCDRGILADRLWADASYERSRASLRTALWRIRCAATDLVTGDANRLALGESVSVDVHQFRRQAEDLLNEQLPWHREHSGFMGRTAELLPGWDEDWLLLAREQLRQLRLHALEASAARLQAAGRYPEAIDIMLAVIADEPLRESAHAALIDAHLRQGNLCEARRQFSTMARLLWNELRVRPAPELARKVGLEPLRQPAPIAGERPVVR